MAYSTQTDITNILNIIFTSSTVPTDTQVTDLIKRADAYVDQISGHNWNPNVILDEQYDAIGTGPRAGTVVLRNRPLLLVNKFEYWETNTWKEGFQGFPGDPTNLNNLQEFYAYLHEGKLVWHKQRLDQRQRYRVSYTYGYGTVPDFVRDLSSSIAARDIILFWGSHLSLQEEISLFKKRLDEKIFRLEARATQRVSASVG